MNTDYIAISSSSRRERWAYVAIVVVFLLAVAAAFRFQTWLDGPGDPAALRLDRGWFYIRDGEEEAIEAFPCTLEVPDEVLVLTRALTREERLHSRYVLTLRGRYASVRAWADDVLIYEAAQGEEHALGSMWHFIPMSKCASARNLTLEIRAYSDEYTLEGFLLDTPGAIRHELLADNFLVVAFSAVCILLAAIMLLAVVLLKRWGSQREILPLSFMLFLLLSGAWSLLDSKITTLSGGNYALPYFLSYAAFFLLAVPFLIYIKAETGACGRLLSVLIWAFVLNAGLSMVLHMAGVVQIRRMAVIVHVLIIVSLPVSTVAIWKSRHGRQENRLRFILLGLLTIYIFGLISIALYHMGRLPAANSAQLYMVGLTALIIGMAADMLTMFSQFWRMREYVDYFRRLAVEDSMTRIGNRNAFQLYLAELLEARPERLAFVVFDVDNLKQINDQMGHHVGDQAIYTAARCIRTVFARVGNCYRIGGDEFAVILTGRAAVNVPELIARFRREVALFWNNALPSRGVSCGWAWDRFSPEAPVTQEDLTRLQAEADRSLYQNKRERKDDTGNGNADEYP